MAYINSRGFGVLAAEQGVPVDSTFNFRKNVELGFSHTNVLTAKANQELGVAATQAPAKMTVGEELGVSATTFASGTVKPGQGVGVGLGSVLTMLSKPEVGQGASITRIAYDYVGTKWVDTATDIGDDAWSNLTDAQGENDGSSATRSGQTLSSTSAAMRCQMKATTNKQEIDLEKVELQYYVTQAGTVLNNGGLGLDYRVGSSGDWTNLATYTGNEDFTTAPATFDLTSLVATWADVGQIEVRITVNLGIATATLSCAVDAVKLHLEGSLVEAV